MRSARPRPFISHIPEPLLEFGMGQKLEYTRDGLFLYGPAEIDESLRGLNYGVIGTPDGLHRFFKWALTVRSFVDVPAPRPRTREKQPQHVPFPGFSEVFAAAWPERPTSVIDSIDRNELERTLLLENRHEAVKRAVDMYVSRLIAENNRLEHPPSVWFVVVPEFVYRLGRPQSIVPRRERLTGKVSISHAQARRFGREPTLFGFERDQISVYEYAPNFHHQLKALLLKDRIVTQLLRETTLAPQDFPKSNGLPQRSVDDPAKLAWNICTTAYYKAGGRPWRLADVRPGVCYVGLAYKRSDEGADRRWACCAAQMFLTHGDGVVFRGATGPWYNVDRHEFHLDRAAAGALMKMVVEEYVHHMGTAPKELFLHAKSRLTRDEWDGFADHVPSGTNLVGVQIRESREVKLFRQGDYPAIRGTVLNVDASTAFLWTSGYVPRLDTYMGPETPNPIRVRVVRGSCPMETVLRDVLSLTKLNYNACIFNDAMPVTITFADAVGSVLLSAPSESEPRLPFKHYI